MIRLIDSELLDEVSREAVASPRLRKNRNFHPADDYPANRLLNAIEPGSYIRPHRHLDANKDETLVVIRGLLALVLFDDVGGVIRTVTVGPSADVQGVDIVHGTWHSAFALEPGTVFFEAKAGPYRPFSAEEMAPWAPPEGSPEAAAYLATLLRMVD
jgi:cupin fold WbuC family metalloprotein